MPTPPQLFLSLALWHATQQEYQNDHLSFVSPNFKGKKNKNPASQPVGHFLCLAPWPSLPAWLRGGHALGETDGLSPHFNRCTLPLVAQAIL